MSLTIDELINEILWKFFALIIISMIESCQNFAHAPTAELSGHVQNSDLIKLLFITLMQQIFLQDLDNELLNK